MRMSFRERIRRVLHYGDPDAETVLMACPPDCPVNLDFVDHERKLRNLGCRIGEVSRNGVLLRLDEPLSASNFNNEKCHIYFKLPPDALERLCFAHEPEQNGFLFKSILLDCETFGEIDAISIALPRSYTRRELRSHERYRMPQNMVADANLWIMPSTASAALINREPSFRLAPGEAASLRIINLSAGGARLSIENTDFLEELTNLDQKNLLLRLALNLSNGQTLENYIICGCVGSNYNIRLRRHTLRLRFLNNKSLWGARAVDALPRLSQWLSRNLAKDKDEEKA